MHDGFKTMFALTQRAIARECPGIRISRAAGLDFSIYDVFGASCAAHDEHNFVFKVVPDAELTEHDIRDVMCWVSETGIPKGRVYITEKAVIADEASKLLVEFGCTVCRVGEEAATMEHHDQVNLNNGMTWKALLVLPLLLLSSILLPIGFIVWGIKHLWRKIIPSSKE